MAESFIPEDTNVICTLQTVPSPLMIKQYREQAFTVHDAKDKPLLNITDKKISGPFECVNIGSFWGGLMTLCLGIAIGALIAAATILTGGLALVALGVALVACGIGIGAGIVALCKIPHACDATLSSSWMEYHPDVTIESQNAILNKSYIQCNNGGLVNLIMDPAIAQAAAQKIGDHNMNYFYIHLGENFLQGLLASPLLNFTNNVEMIASPASAVICYFIFEWNNDINDHENPKTAVDVVIGESIDAVTEGVAGDAIEDIIQMGVNKTVAGDSFARGLLYSVGGAAWSAGGRVAGSTSDDLLGAMIHGLGKNQIKSNSGQFMKGAAISLAISVAAGIWKNSEHNKAKKESDNADEEDSANGISVVAVEV